jgi:biopolymer transport protein ExbD
MKQVRQSGSGVNLGLIITPFLDMAFQILAFFIMTYHPSHLEGHVDGSLMPKGAGQGGVIDPLAPVEPPIAEVENLLNDVLQVSVKTSTNETQRTFDGQPRLIVLKRPQAAGSDRIAEGDTWDSAKKKLKDALAAFLQEKGRDKNAKASVKIDADSDLKHQYVMDVYDVCKQAGISEVSFVSPVFERKKN